MFFDFLLIYSVAILAEFTTRAAYDRKCIMVTISATRTLPVKMTVFVLDNLNLAIIATSLAVV